MRSKQALNQAEPRTRPRRGQKGEARLSGLAPTSSEVKRRTSGWFWVWVAVGAVTAAGFLEFGALFLVPAAVLACLVARRPEVRRSAFGASMGVGLVALFVAYLNRQGPGFTCWHTALASGCDQHVVPWPWLAT